MAETSPLPPRLQRHAQTRDTTDEVVNAPPGYRGGRARLWWFSASRDRLAIELTDDEGGRRVLLGLAGCDEIRLPVGRKIANPEVRQLGPSSFELIDDVYFKCRGVSFMSFHPQA